MKTIFALTLLALSLPTQARNVPSFSGIAAQVSAGVVNIRTRYYRTRQNPGIDLNQFFLDGRIPPTQSTHSLGSGFILSQSGYIITNHHIIEGVDSLFVLFPKSKQTLPAELVGSDPQTNVAVLKVANIPSGRALDLGSSGATQVGDWLIAVGNPYGFSPTVAKGILSAKGPVVGSGVYDQYFQTDINIHPGNSGGPIVDFRGRVIGIAAAVATSTRGIGYIVPIDKAKPVIQQLRQSGNVVRPWLGIVGRDILSPEDIDQGTNPSGVHGVIIGNLVVNAPAHQAGLQIGDVITMVNDKRVSDLSHLQKMIYSQSVGSRLSLKVFRKRKGNFISEVKLDPIPKATDLPTTKDLL